MFLRRLRPRLGALPLGFRDLLSGSSWLILGAVAGQGSMLLANLIVARTLGVTDFGRYALLQTSVSLLALLAQVGFGVVVAQQVSSYRTRNPELAGEIAGFCLLVTALLGLILAMLLFLGRDLLAEDLFRDPAIRTGVALAALGVPWFALSTVQQGLFNGLERFRDQALVSLLLCPVAIGLPAAGAWQSGLGGALIGLGFVYFARASVSHLILSRALNRAGIRWSVGDPGAKLRLLWRLALPAALAGALVSLAIWGGQTVLLRSQGSPALLGQFAAAFAVKTMVMFVPTQMIGALLPLLSRNNATHGEGRRGLLYLNVAASLAVSIGLAAPGILFAPAVMGLFGPGFAGASSVLVILLCAAPLEAVTITLYQDVQAKGLFWRTMIAVNLPLAATVLTAAAFLVPIWQADGLATSWLIGWAVALCGVILAMGRRSMPAAKTPIDRGLRVEAAPLP